MKKIHFWGLSYNHFGGGIGKFVEEVICSLRKNNDVKSVKLFAKHDKYKSYKGYTIHKTFGGINLIKNICYAFMVSLYSLLERPTLIFCSHINYSPCALFLKFFIKIPYVISVYGVDVDSNISFLKKISLKNANKIITISRWTKEKLLDQGLPESKITIIGLTASKEKFNINSKEVRYYDKFKIKNSCKIILTVSRLDSDEKYKGYDRIINCMPEIIKIIPNVHYLLVGCGDDRERIENLINKKNLNKFVTLAGYIEDEDLPGVYNFCDIFAMPSSNEGFGIVFIEALLSGIPVLGGNIDGTRDALDDGNLGLLINPIDEKALLKSLVMMLKNKIPKHQLDPNILRNNCIKVHSSEKFQRKIRFALSSIK